MSELEKILSGTSPDANYANACSQRDAAIDWNHRVSVCADHTSEIVDGPCVICERDRFKAINAQLIEALEDAEFLMRKAAQIAGPMQDSFKRSAEDASAALKLAKGE